MIDIRQLPNLTIEQKDFVNRFYAQFNYAAAGSGLNRHIANVEPVLFEGVIAASEFTVYAATKLYLCFDFVAVYDGGSGTANAYVLFYNENNAINFVTQNKSIAYNSIAPAIEYQKNDTNIKNIYFSRIVQTVYNYMKFIGYRITLD